MFQQYTFSISPSAQPYTNITMSVYVQTHKAYLNNELVDTLVSFLWILRILQNSHSVEKSQKMTMNKKAQ